MFRSFSTRLSVYILIISGMVFCFATAMFYSYSSEREEKQAIRYTMSLINNMSLSLGETLEQIENELNYTGQFITDSGTNPNLPATVERIIKNIPSIMGSGIAFEPYCSPSGDEYCMYYTNLDSMGNAHTKMLGGKDYDYFEMPWYKETIKSGKPGWSKPYFDKGGGNRLMITYSVPLRDKNDRIYAVITADLFLNEFSSQLDSLKPYNDSYTFLLSKNGTFLAHRDKKLVMASTIFSISEKAGNTSFAELGRKMLNGESGTYVITNFDGEHALAFYTPVPILGWSICNICPYDTILGHVRYTALLALIVLMCCLLVLSVGIRIMVKKQTRPLEMFADAARKVANGNFNEALPEISTKDEMLTLRDSFAYMQKSLAKYIEDLKITTAENERIKNELDISRNIQMDMLPFDLPEFSVGQDVELAAELVPAKQVGGDLYSYSLRDNKLFFAIGDVSGKSIPAALVMAVTQSRFSSVCNYTDSPAEIMNFINKQTSDKNTRCMFVTMFAGVLDLSNGKLRYCNAGHELPLLVTADGRSAFVDIRKNLPLGVCGDFRYRESSLVLEKNSKIVLYTDGVSEAEDKKHCLFSRDRLQELAGCLSDKNAKESANIILQAVKNYADGADQSDDIAVMVLTYKGDRGELIYKDELVMKNSADELKKLYGFIEKVAEKCKFDPKLSNNVLLAVEEAVINIISYAYDKNTVGYIDISVQCTSSVLQFHIKDSGKPFNPCASKAVDTTLTVKERPIGGLGIFLMEKLMDEVSYQRTKDGYNCLCLKKLI